MELDEHLQKLMQDLGIAINDALSDSAGVTEAIESVRNAGYDVFLVLEATIGVRRRAEGAGEDGEEGVTERPEGDGSEIDDADTRRIQLRINDQDLKFLKSLRIRVDDSD